MVEIELNGRSIATSHTSLRGLLEEQLFDSLTVATAVDGTFVPREKRGEFILKPGSKVEVLSPMQGG